MTCVVLSVKGLKVLKFLLYNCNIHSSVIQTFLTSLISNWWRKLGCSTTDTIDDMRSIVLSVCKYLFSFYETWNISYRYLRNSSRVRSDESISYRLQSRSNGEMFYLVAFVAVVKYEAQNIIFAQEIEKYPFIYNYKLSEAISRYNARYPITQYVASMWEWTATGFVWLVIAIWFLQLVAPAGMQP